MNPDSPQIYQVAVPVPLRRAFDYSSELDLQPGQRVLVPFGRRELVGVVLSRSTHSKFEKIREIKTALDNSVAFPRNTLSLLQWASQYYHHPVGEVVSAALPVSAAPANRNAGAQRGSLLLQKPRGAEIKR